jgi:hypothetical protein
MEYDLTPAIDASPSAKGRDPITGIRAIREDWAACDFYRLDGPAIGQITKFCMAALDQTAEGDHALVVNKRAAMDPAAWAQLRAAHLAFLETRIPLIVEDEIAYADALSTAAQQLLMKQDGILTSAQHIPGAP